MTFLRALKETAVIESTGVVVANIDPQNVHSFYRRLDHCTWKILRIRAVLLIQQKEHTVERKRVNKTFNGEIKLPVPCFGSRVVAFHRFFLTKRRTHAGPKQTNTSYTTSDNFSCPSLN